MAITTKELIFDPHKIADAIERIAPQPALKQLTIKPDYSAYKNDHVKFAEKILGDHFTDDIKKLMKSVSENIITIGMSCNGIGKTHAAARIAVAFFLTHKDSQVYTAAAPPFENLKHLIWGEIGSIIRRKPEVFKGMRILDMHIERNSQSFLTGVTIPSSGTPEEREAKFSGKHSANILFILDEGDAIPDEVYKGIESCMSGGNARLLILFNPRAETGAAYRMIRDRKANVVELPAFNHPNVLTGKDIIPGAVTREKTVFRICDYTIPLGPGENPDSECFQVPNFLVGCTAQKQGGGTYEPIKAGFRRVIEPSFFYMVLGQYPVHGTNQLISKEWIYKARTRWDLYVAAHGIQPPKDVFPVVGFDVADMGSDSNVWCENYGGWIAPLITWKGVDPDMSAQRGIELYFQKKVQSCNVDSTGVGAGVAPKMRRANCRFANRIMVASKPTAKTEFGIFGIYRDQLWWQCREWLAKDDTAMLPPDEWLIEELSIPTYEIKNGIIKVMSKDVMKDILKRSPDKGDALCLSLIKQQKKARLW